MGNSRPLSERLSKTPPVPNPIPSELVALNQRERILLAIAELVAERGYQKTTIELIAKTARVALVTFYEQFESKEECFLAAFDETVDDAEEVLDELLDPEQAWPDQVAAGLEILLAMIAADPNRARIVVVEAQAAGVAALARYQAMLERVGARLREGRALNPRAKLLPDGLEVAIAGGLAWLIHQRLVADRADELKGLLPEMLQITLTPYIGEVEASRAADAAQERMAA
jgi:AcrR family transcriptional regulator